MRTRPPALRTLPSRTWLTPSWCATSLTFGDLPLKPKAVLRAQTSSAETLLRSVMMSSLIPSEKYSCSGSPLMLANGRTQMESLRTAFPDARGLLGDARLAIAPTTCFHPGVSLPPDQPARSAHWVWSNGIGRRAPSTLSWTSLVSARAPSASQRTHSAPAPCADHPTTTPLAVVQGPAETSAQAP